MFICKIKQKNIISPYVNSEVKKHMFIWKKSKIKAISPYGKIEYKKAYEPLLQA